MKNENNNENNLNNSLIKINAQINNIQIDSDSETESKSTSNNNSSSNFFSIKNIRNRIHSSQIDFGGTKKPKYNGLINEDEAEKISSEKIMKEVESVNIFKIYKHLNTPFDWFLTVLAIIGSISAGISIPIMSYTTSDVYSNLANTSENRDSEINIEEMKLIVEKTLNYQIKKQLLNGILSFVFYFTSICFWSLVGNRCIYSLKKKYFTIILSQEQAWFDKNNPYEISTNVHSQLETIEQGVGDKVGIIITSISQCILGFIFAFISSWKLTLVMSCVVPIAVMIPNYLFITMRNGIVLARRTWGMSGGIIEELLYNIKTVASFANFEYELNKYNNIIEN